MTAERATRTPQDVTVPPGLLAEAGIVRSHARIRPCATGGNNRIFEVCSGERRFALKRYTQPITGGRDRLDSEWRFLKFTEAAGVPTTPRPIARDDQEKTALYEFIDGRKTGPDDVSAETVSMFADFIAALNAEEAREHASALPEASETAFSISGHLEIVDAKRAALDGVGEDRLKEVLSRLDQLLKTYRPVLLDGAGDLDIAPDTPLARKDRVVSPSDMGFHNALRHPDGSLRFIDFEYAGWDDPAKLLADFFFQPAVPVPEDHAPAFVARALGELTAHGLQRAALLKPLFGFRWCFIVLNPFLESWQARAPAPLSAEALSDLRAARLQAASHLLDKLSPLLQKRRRPDQA